MYDAVIDKKMSGHASHISNKRDIMRLCINHMFRDDTTG
jgi:hypothetical protein